MSHFKYTTREFHSSAQNALGMEQSRLKSISGRPVKNNANCLTARVGAYALSPLLTIASVKHGGTRQLQELLVDLLSKWLRRVKITHMSGVGGFKRTCNGHFAEFANQLLELDPDSPAQAEALRYRQGIIPDLMLDAA